MDLPDPNKDLLQKAILILTEQYDLDADSFFLVMTKDGKDPRLDVCDQSIVGELNIKTLVAFILQAINQLCASINLSPHVFITRYIVGALLEQERERMFDMLGPSTLFEEPLFGADYLDEDEEEEEYIVDDEEFGEEEDEVIYVTNPDWESVKN